MVFVIDGLDMMPYIAYGGIKWQRSDLDGPGAGRTLDGVMHRGRVASKIRLDVTCVPLASENSSLVLNAIQPEFVTATYTDPRDGLVTRRMYSNNTPATFARIKPDGDEEWDGITFPLIEE